jgi:predicted acetyltransferase
VTELPDPYELRTATDKDFDGIWRMLMDAFGSSDAEEDREASRIIFEPDRYTVITHRDRVVANAGIYTREMTVPGAVIPAAHVTGVGVDAGHRRKGLLRRLITHQFATAPEPFHVLWASEGRIYQRFGYGMASRNATLDVAVREVTHLPSAPPATGTFRTTLPAEVMEVMAQVYERARVRQPGFSGREERQWRKRWVETASRRDGASPQRVVVYETADGPDGYAAWRIKQNWGVGPGHETRLIELVAATDEAYAALWRFLFDLDLTRRLTTGPIGADDPIMYLVDEPTRLGARVSDGLWVRLTNLPDALRARKYAAPLDVVVEVTDEVLPDNAGRWRLRAGPDGALTCERSADPAELACDVADLGAAYLGGTKLGQLALAGRVRELREGALPATSTAFGWPTAPTAIEIF